MPLSRADLDRLRLDPHQRRLSTGSSRWRLAVVCLLLAGGAFLYGRWERVAAQKPARVDGATPARPETALPEPRARDGVVVAGGFLEAKRDAVIYPGRDGVVASVHVRPGQKVSQGDLLLELVADAARADLAAAEAGLRSAEARHALAKAGSRKEEVQRAQARSEAAKAHWQKAKADLTGTRRLVQKRSESGAELERAVREERVARARLDESLANERIVRLGTRPEELQLAAAEVDKARAGVRRARARLDLSQLRAPFDSTVVRIDLEPGEVVNMISSPYAQPGLEVADVSELWARLDVPETRIGRVRIGASAAVVVEALGSEALAAEVVEIAPVADRQSNTVSVAVRILEPPELIRPHMSARVTIHKEKDK